MIFERFSQRGIAWSRWARRLTSNCSGRSAARPAAERQDVILAKTVDARRLDTSFEQYLSEQGLNPAVEAAVRGLRSVIRFYAERRARGCDAYAEEDMLLFQWGTYDWGNGKHFEVNMTRQVMLPDTGDDEAIWQLGLTYYWLPLPELRALGSGGCWCKGLDNVAAFESSVCESAVLSAVDGCRPVHHEIVFECAG
jgi:hypothetical protein